MKVTPRVCLVVIAMTSVFFMSNPLLHESATVLADSGVNSNSTSDVMNSLFGNTGNLASGSVGSSGQGNASRGGEAGTGSKPSGQSPSPSPSIPPVSTNTVSSQVIEPDYSSVLSTWRQSGFRDAPTFQMTVHPSQLRTSSGTASLLPQADTHGYDEPALNWNDANLTYVEFSVKVPTDGLYQIGFDYLTDSPSLVPIERGIEINGLYQYFESRTITLSKRWRDSSSRFPTDQAGEQLPPNELPINQWRREWLMDSSGLHDAPLRFHLNKGYNVIRIVNVSENIVLGRLYVRSPQPLISYQQYEDTHRSTAAGPVDLIRIQAEHPSEKSDPSIRALPNADAGVTPQRTGVILLNTLGDTSWQNGGQSVTWTMHVPKSGLYHIAFKYKQSEQINLPTFRTLEIDGSIPFRDVERIAFPYTTSWQNKVLGDDRGSPYQFYFSQGSHSLTLIADPAPYETVIRTVRSVMKGLDGVSLSIKMETGNTLDPNRDWNMTAIMPKLPAELTGYAKALRQAYGTLSVQSGGSNPDQVQSLLISAERLEALAAQPNTIPYRFQTLTDGAGSVNESLGNVLISLPEQPLLLDQLYVYSQSALPSPHVGVYRNAIAGLMRFIYSFTHNYSMVGTNSPAALTVWVNRPREYVTLMQQLADEDFTRKTGIKVAMMVMPDESKLVLANAANQTPDVALGVDNKTPFNMGIRGAAVNLAQFKDFPQVEARFSKGALLPFVFNEASYGLPETQDFWVLFYRKDILNALHLRVPNNWNDVIRMLPQLQRYGMNFYDPLAGVGGMKWMYSTVPFIYDSGGQLFHADGMTTAIDSERVLNGFKLMTNLFTVYGLPLQVPNFYSHFRSGDLPIGISNFTTYVQLSSAAPELNGLWGIAPMPGIQLGNGQTLRYAPGTGEADFIFAQSKRQQAAWAFLKWWTSAQTQEQYGNQLQTVYGPSYSWNSSNLHAFQQLPWPVEDIHTILRQWQWLEDVPHVPGDYMLERGISNAWNAVVFDGTNPRMAIGDAVIQADREIRVQLQGLGYIDAHGKVVKGIHMPQFPN